MVKYFVVDSEAFMLDENGLHSITRGWISVRDYFLVEEDGILEDQEVHAGDVIVTYYSDNNHGKKFTIHPKGSVVAEMVTDSINNRKNNQEAIPGCGECCGCKDSVPA